MIRWLLVATCVLFTACKKGERPASAPPDGPDAGAAAPAPAGTKPALALARDGLLRVPAEARLVAVAANPVELADRLGRALLVTRFAEPLAEARQELIKTVGHDLLEPANLPKVGIDPTAPAGVGVLHLQGPQVVVFFGLSNVDTFRTMLGTLAALAHETLNDQTVGTARVVHPTRDDDVALVLTERTAWIVLNDRRGPDVRETARRLAGLDPKASMAESPTFRSSVERLDYGRDAGLFVNIPQMIDEVMAMFRHDVDRARGLRRAKLEAQLLMAQNMVAGIGAIAVGAQVEAGRVEARGHFQLKRTAPPGNIFQNIEGHSATWATVTEAPLAVAAGRVDPKALWSLVRTVALALKETRDLDEGTRELSGLLGISFDPDLIGLLSGEVGFAMAADPEKLALARYDTDRFAQMSGGLVVGLTDAAAAKKAFDTLRTGPLVTGLVRSEGERIALPLGEKTLWIGLAGDYLVVSPDAGTFDRVAKGAFAPPTPLRPASAASTFAPGATFTGLLDWRLPGYMDTLRPPYEAVERPVDPVEGAVAPSDAERKRIEAELARLRADLDATRKARRARTQALAKAIFARLGVTAAHVAAVEDGLRFTVAQHVMDADVGTTVAEVAGGIEELERTRWKGWDEDDAVLDRIRALEAQLGGDATKIAPPGDDDAPVVAPDGPALAPEHAQEEPMMPPPADGE
ncbi:MAG: hypothetical protein H6704_17925 [Myxococcales bacterium]|nr:hypothetical protein [Myxococcales bacterium]